MTQLTNGTHRKRVKLVKENARNYNGQKGTVYIHMITFDDDSTGEHHSTKQQSEFFKQGLEVDFECEVKVNGQYTNYKIKPVKFNSFPPKTGSYGGNSIESAKWQAAGLSLDIAAKLVISGKIDINKIVDQAKRNYQIISEIVSEEKPADNGTSPQ
jgi:hypothetical protein